MIPFDPSFDRPHFRYNYTWLLPFERDFDPARPTVWMQQNWTQSLILSAVYVAMIYAGRYIMKARKGYDLKWPLVLWNGGLAIFSILGTLRYAPDFFWVLTKFGFTHSICVCAFHHGVTGLWSEWFAFSKAVELGDTAFLVLRKRPIMFLHWYHHITVMVYTWHGLKDHTAAGRWFIMMNYFVHSLMYSYYALRAAGIRFPKQIPMAVTLIQLSQMVVGIVVAMGTYRAMRAGVTCQQTEQNAYLGFAMYLSYFLLFTRFFYLAYFKTAKYDTKAPKPGPAADNVGANGAPPLNSDIRKRQPAILNPNGQASNGFASHGTNESLNISSGFTNPTRNQNGHLANGTMREATFGVKSE